MAETFFEEGYRVWVTDIDQSALDDCPDQWKKTCVDATDRTAVQSLFQSVEAEWGTLDVLCSNAGIPGPTADIETMEPEGFMRCVSVNLEGAFLATKYATPIFKKSMSGCILFTSSMSGVNGFPNRSAYASAKWAINGFMKTVAMELGPFGIRTNSLCPGSVDGPRMDSVIEREAAAKNTTADVIRNGYAKGVSMRTFVEASDVANMAVFLASEKARFISGQIIGIDGHTENPDPKV